MKNISKFLVVASLLLCSTLSALANYSTEKSALERFFSIRGTDYASVVALAKANPALCDSVNNLYQNSFAVIDTLDGEYTFTGFFTLDGKKPDKANADSLFFGDGVENYLDTLTLKHVFNRLHPIWIEEINKCMGDYDKKKSEKDPIFGVLPCRIDGIHYAINGGLLYYLQKLMTTTKMSRDFDAIEVAKCALNSDVYFKAMAQMVEAFQQSKIYKQASAKPLIYGKSLQKAERLKVMSNYLYFTSKDGGTVRLDKKGSAQTINQLTATFEYSKDKKNWTEYNWGELEANIKKGDEIKLANSDTVWFRASGEGGKNATLSTYYSNLCYSFVFGEKDSIYAGGNIMSLYDATCMQDIMTEGGFANLFGSCKQLVKAPELPARKLAKYCYRAMFSSCYGLKEAPELPAETMEEYCYALMFNYCKSLVKIPELKVKNLATECFSQMFYSNTKLRVDSAGINNKGVKLVIPTTTSGASEWNKNMFYDCYGDSKCVSKYGIQMGGVYYVSEYFPFVIGDKGYNSLAEAIKAAQEGDILKLQGKYTMQATDSVMIPGGVVLDRNGFSLTTKGKFGWDITKHKASMIDFNGISNVNNTELDIVTSLDQPKDTVYVLAIGLQQDNAPLFTLTGISGRNDQTVSIGGTLVFYGNRGYKLYLAEESKEIKERNGGKVRPTIKKDYLLKLEIKSGVCRNKETEVLYETLDEAIANVQPGQTIELLGDLSMENNLKMPANTYLDLNGCTLTNPQGLDLKWDLTKDNAPVIKDFDKLAAQGTLTLNMNDLQTRKQYVIAQDAAGASGREFILTGAPTADKKDRSVTVGGEPVFYGHRHYSLALEGNNIVLNVTKVTPPSGEFWGVSVDGSQLSLTIDDNFNVSHTSDNFIQKDNLTHFQFNGPITRIGVATLKGNLNLKEVYFPASVEFIGQDAIRDCENLEYASMLDVQATAIGPNAFEGCKKLSIVEWPAKLEEIDAFAFAYCEALEDITLPATLQRIYGNAFSYCSDLKSVTLLSTSMERLWAESFDKCHKDLAIYVPYLSLTDYEALSSARGLNFQTKIPVSNSGIGKNTVYCHHNMIIPDGVTFWTMNTNLTEQKVTQQFVPGGAGYVVKFEAGVNSVEVVTTSQLATIAYRNILTGVNKATAVSEILKGYDGTTLCKMDPSTGSFYSFTSEMPAYQAFYVMQGGIPVSFTYDEATGIANVDVDPELVEGDADADANSYNAAGQKVANGYKGIVIKNGKKYLNK